LYFFIKNMERIDETGMDRFLLTPPVQLA